VVSFGAGWLVWFGFVGDWSEVRGRRNCGGEKESGKDQVGKEKEEEERNRKRKRKRERERKRNGEVKG
jgi:hypothetical protein